MKSKFESGLFKSIATLVVMAMLLLSLSPMTAFAQSKHTQAKEDEMILLLLKYIEVDERSNTFFLNKEELQNADLPQDVIFELNNNFENLTYDQQSILYSVGQGDISLQAAPVAVVAAFLAGAVAGWMIDALLDKGVNWFCNKYRNSNWATKSACFLFG